MFTQQQSYERLPVWKQAMLLVERVYRASARFPAEEKSGMTATLRKSAAVIPGRIIEGDSHDDPAEARKSFRGARAALRDLETNLLLCRRLGLIGMWVLRPLRKRCRQLERLLDDEAEACAMEIEETIQLAQAA